MEVDELIIKAEPILKKWVDAMLAEVATRSKSYPKEMTLPITFDGRYFEMTVVIPGYIESGRRPGKRPPFPPIHEWVKAQKLMPKDNQSIEQITYAVMNTIGKKGTLPKMFLTDAYANAPTPDLGAILDEYFINHYPELLEKKR